MHPFDFIITVVTFTPAELVLGPVVFVTTNPSFYPASTANASFIAAIYSK